MSEDSYMGFVATDSQNRRKIVEVQKKSEAGLAQTKDQLTVEEPLEIRICAPQIEETVLAVTMRTPGQDHELALGFLFSEGIIQSISQVESVEHCRPPSPDKGYHNSIRITLDEEAIIDLESLSRHVYTNSSCGICGKTSIDSVMGTAVQPIPDTVRIEARRLMTLPEELSKQQLEFSETGGTHAAGLVDANGDILCVREDIGRHNALDKLFGCQLMQNAIPLHGHALILSGRPGFELVQKAAFAGIEVVAGIGPPSTLAQELAHEAGLTLAGFVRDSGYNLYTHPQRVLTD